MLQNARFQRINGATWRLLRQACARSNLTGDILSFNVAHTLRTPRIASFQKIVFPHWSFALEMQKRLSTSSQTGANARHDVLYLNLSRDYRLIVPDER